MPSLLDLPPELLDHVLFFLLPPDSPSMYSTRMDALRALALTSKTMRAATCAELFRDVWLFEVDQAIRFLEAARANDALKHVHTLKLSSIYTEEEDVDKAAVEVVRACPQLRKLNLKAIYFDLAALEGLSHLRDLVLESTSVAVSQPVFLPSLIEFSSTFSVSPVADQSTLFTPASLPSLRIVSLRHPSELSPAFPPTLANEPVYFFPSPAILPQLDLLSHGDQHLLSLTAPSTLLVFSIGVENVESCLPALSAAVRGNEEAPLAVRLFEPYGSADASETDDANGPSPVGQRIVDLLQQAIPPNSGRALPILLFPHFFATKNPTPPYRSLSSYPAQILYDSPPEDTLVSPHFRRWATAHRAAKALL